MSTLEKHHSHLTRLKRGTNPVVQVILKKAITCAKLQLLEEGGIVVNLKTIENIVSALYGN